MLSIAGQMAKLGCAKKACSMIEEGMIKKLLEVYFNSLYKHR